MPKYPLYLDPGGAGTPAHVKQHTGIDLDNPGTAAGVAIPVGACVEWYAPDLPSVVGGVEYVWPDGTTYLNTDFPLLKAVLVDSYSPGSSSPWYIDSTHFKVPDRRQRMAVAATKPDATSIAVPAITWGANATGTETGGVTPVLPAGTVEGDLLVAHVSAADSFVNTPAGWTTTASNSVCVIAWKIAEEGETNPTFTAASGSVHDGMLAKVGRIPRGTFDPIDPVKLPETVLSGTDTSAETDGPTIDVENSLVLYFASTYVTNAVLTFTPPVGDSELYDFGHNPGTDPGGRGVSQTAMSKTAISMGDAGDETFTISSTPTGWASVSIAVRPARFLLGDAAGQQQHDHDSHGVHNHGVGSLDSASGGGHTHSAETHTHTLSTATVSTGRGTGANNAAHEVHLHNVSGDGSHTHNAIGDHDHALSGSTANNSAPQEHSLADHHPPSLVCNYILRAA